MSSPRYVGALFIVLGIIFLALTASLSGGTERACDMNSVVYDTIGIHPTESTLTEIDLSNAEVQWYDGCNWHDGPLIPFLLGLGSITVGSAVLGRDGYRKICSAQESS